MQQNFDEQLANKESEIKSRLDNMNQEHDNAISGVLMHFTLFLVSFSFLVLIIFVRIAYCISLLI